MKNPNTDEKERIDVKYFDELEGLDDTTITILNEKIKYAKELFESRIEDHIKYQKKLMIDLARYKALTPDSYGFMNYTLEEVFQNVRIIEKNAELIWKTMKTVFGKTFFIAQVQEEYSQSFSEKDKEILDAEILNIKREAERNLKNVLDKWEAEIKELRHEFNDKAIEVNQAKSKHKHEIETLKEIYTGIGYREAEQVYKEKEAIAFQKHDDEKVDFFRQLREAEELNLNFTKMIEEHKIKAWVGTKIITL